MSMSAFAFAAVVLIVAVLLLWLADVIPQRPPANMIAKVVVIVVALIAICDKAGLL